MIECGRDPSSRAMTGRAICREALRDVVRVIRAIVLSLVARVASRGRRHITVVGMALGAGSGRMLASQRVMCVQRMIELCRRPVDRRVARAAISWETQLNVGRILGVVEVSAVT